jgi:protocatechuate 3,4-dioxygenase beta subunit
MALLVILWNGPSMASAANRPFLCTPTAGDEMGPFYRPDAPFRTSVGSGYLLIGTVKSAADCSPVANARIELWMTGPDGRYGDAWRATLFSAENGTYYFTSHPPTEFGSRRPHIHIRATAPGFLPLVTQHYPPEAAGEGLFDLVLIPAQQ